MHGLGGGPQHLVAFAPVAGAKFVGLQRVENTQRLGRVAADVESVDRDVLDDVVRIDDEGGAEGDPLFGRQDAERFGVAEIVGSL